ncbi:hypothetical protein [Streptomyces coelicoflavus]|uniref:hypothetical protein n=1 Tax=Streptomyces coelicoflavus TaxID=285562 RepID=UPI003F49D21E
MTAHIERLVQQLDDSTGPSYDARAELIGIGSDAIPALIDGLPSLGGFGQLTAIEVFEEVADPRCGPALISLLDSDDSTVREWGVMINQLGADLRADHPDFNTERGRLLHALGLAPTSEEEAIARLRAIAARTAPNHVSHVPDDEHLPYEPLFGDGLG